MKKIPEFNAENSLYRTSGHYQIARLAFNPLIQGIRSFHPAAETIEVFGCPPGTIPWLEGDTAVCILTEPSGGGEQSHGGGGGGNGAGPYGGGGGPGPKPKRPQLTPEEKNKAKEIGKCKGRCEAKHTAELEACVINHVDNDVDKTICRSVADNVLSRCKTRCEDEPHHNE